MKTIILFTCFLAAQTGPCVQQAIAANPVRTTAIGSTEPEQFQTDGPKQYETHRVYFKDSVTTRFSGRKLQGQKAYLQFKKLAPQEYPLFRQTVLSDGFLEGKSTRKDHAGLFQKKNTTITVIKSGDAATAWYEVTIEKKALPRLKEIRFAEDLLLFDAHQHLITVFGARNVVKDLFYNVDGTAVACSVIYPNSSREAVFLWQDTSNLRQLAAIRVGSNMRTAGAIRNNNIAPQNQWQSQQGLYPTMTLNQLQSQNGNPLFFYGWGAGAQGRLCSYNKGNIDFRALDLSFSCLNCNDDNYYGPQQLASDKTIAEGRRIFIATMIFYPPPAGNE